MAGKWSIWFGMFLVLLSACRPFTPPAPTSPAARGEILLATTTSTYDSGLLDALLPDFEAQTGYTVKVIAVGTGQALRMGREGNADVLLTHAPQAERPLVEEGWVVDYRLVMYNDFVLVGPDQDPAGVREVERVVEAFTRIAQARALFVSRGDDSGTHKKERSIWDQAGLTPYQEPWYLESGQGMGATLQIASEKQAYTLTDRGTYLALRDALELEILFEGDPLLLNIYHIMRVNPERYPQVNEVGGKALVAYFVDPKVQERIGQFGVDRYGQPLFFPAAHMTMEELMSRFAAPAEARPTPAP